MLIALLLVLIATLGGLSLTYLYDDDAPFLVRLAMGFMTGIVAQGLLVFALALHFNLTLGVIAIGSLPLLTPLLVFRSALLRQRLKKDVKRLPHFRGRSRYRFPHLLLSLALMGVLLAVFRGVIYIENGAIWTNNHHNFGDLPWHVALLSLIHISEPTRPY